MHVRLGNHARMQAIGQRVIRDHILEEHSELFGKLPFLVLGAVDDAGQPWASLVTGSPGFVSTTARTMHIAALPPSIDPVRAALRLGAPVGVLGIELTTRRRNRLNGHVMEVTPQGFTLSVDQSFGNCPKYIQVREHRSPKIQHAPVSRPETSSLSAEAAQLITSSDTFFIASSDTDGVGETKGVDASHRGGKPGFVRVAQAGARTFLEVPDFRGNGFFNTLGNLLLNPLCGLLFLDFEAGHLLQIAARGSLVLDGPALASFEGAERLLQLDVLHGGWIRNGVGLRWNDPQFATQLQATGDWPKSAE